ncbi:beta-eliminating lyase-related protein [Cognatishimia sp. WU-CL00825]|uniref:threonine aldolase family protein n=1 Tax=Cognatishimia sp. WU-CL00825 TaxID=3127658 RepID=UPI0031049EFE
MHFASDNAGIVHPQILAALSEANQGFAMAYGNDEVTKAAQERLRTLFESPLAEVFFVPTGTAANALALASFTQPFQTVYCTPLAHIQEDEANAPEFFTGGAKLTLVGAQDKMQPSDLRAALERSEQRGVHGAQAGPVSITQVTEFGQVYTLDELSALTEIARAFGVPVHLDGARFANACATLNCSAADMTWKSGVDVACFGGTKNGCMGVEAVVIFNPDLAQSFQLRRKRAGHLFSKQRYLAAQMLGYLENDLWLSLAKQSNQNCAYLASKLRGVAGVEFDYAPEANLIFCNFPTDMHTRLMAAGAQYHVTTAPADARQSARLVCDWSISTAQIDAFVAAMTD